MLWRGHRNRARAGAECFLIGAPGQAPMTFAGLMLRALDGRPEMWDYLEREVRAQFDDWVYRRKTDPKLYYDIRDDGYAQLYAVMIAKVLPVSYPLYANGTLSPRTGTATNGAQKRAVSTLNVTLS